MAREGGGGEDTRMRRRGNGWSDSRMLGAKNYMTNVKSFRASFPLIEGNGEVAQNREKQKSSGLETLASITAKEEGPEAHYPKS